MTHNYSSSTWSALLAPCQPSVEPGKCHRRHPNGEKRMGEHPMDLPLNHTNWF